jgi:hypothetical protein
MGLFRKAVGSAPPDATAAPSPAPLPFAPQPAAGSRSGGLLRRGARLRESPAPAAEPGLPRLEGPDTAFAPAAEPVAGDAPVHEFRAAARAAAEVVDAIGRLPDGVELPSRLFSIVSAGLAVRKGALLLYDALRLVYAPWASTGYDQTTLSRLRIPLGATTSFNALANGDPLILTDPASLAPYQEYFSSREFSFVTRLIMTPFIAGESLVAVLLLSDLGSSDDTDEDLREAMRAVAAAGSPRVNAARARKLTASGPSAPQAPLSLEAQASRFLGTPTGAATPALLLALTVEDYSRRVLAEHQHLDPFRLHEDLHYFLGTYVSDMGTALAVRPGRFILALRSLDTGDIDLFVHQLTLYLDGLFGGQDRTDKAAAPRVLKLRAWPADGDDVRSLIDDLAS